MEIKLQMNRVYLAEGEDFRDFSFDEEALVFVATSKKIIELSFPSLHYTRSYFPKLKEGENLKFIVSMHMQWIVCTSENRLLTTEKEIELPPIRLKPCLSKSKMHLYVATYSKIVIYDFNLPSQLVFERAIEINLQNQEIYCMFAIDSSPDEIFAISCSGCYILKCGNIVEILDKPKSITNTFFAVYAVSCKESIFCYSSSHKLLKFKWHFQFEKSSRDIISTDFVFPITLQKVGSNAILAIFEQGTLVLIDQHSLNIDQITHMRRDCQAAEVVEIEKHYYLITMSFWSLTCFQLDINT